MSIALRGISKQFGEFAAGKNIDLDVPTGALIWQQHRPDHLAVVHRLQRLFPAFERRRSRHHSCKVELALERAIHKQIATMLFASSSGISHR